MKTFSKDEFEKLYGTQTYQMFGEESAPKPQPLGTRLAQPFTRAQEAISGEGEYAGQSSVRRGTEAFAQITGAPLNTAYQLLPQGARQDIAKLGEFASTPFQMAAEEIGSSPELQKWVMENPEAAKNLEEIAGTLSSGGKIAGDLLLYSLFSKGRPNVDARSKAIESNIDRQNRIYADQIKNTEIMKATGPGGERVLSMDQQRALSQLPEAPVQAAQVVPPATLTPSPVSKALGAATRPLVQGAQKTGSYGSRLVKDIAPTAEGFITQNVTKALDLAPSDISNIYKSTGNNVGKWVADKNLIRETKDLTRDAIEQYKNQQFQEVRAQIGQVDRTYTSAQIPRYTDALNAIIKQSEKVLGLEEVWARATNLKNKKDIKLDDVQEVKELLDDQFSLYKVTGDVKDAQAKVGLANVRSELRKFIEDEVKDVTKADIRKLNNDVATAKSLADAIKERSAKAMLAKIPTLGDWTTFGFGASIGGGLMSPSGILTGAAFLFTKKVLESPMIRLRLAKIVDEMDDAAKEKALRKLQQGAIPEEFDELIEYKP